LTPAPLLARRRENAPLRQAEREHCRRQQRHIF
jgi:hypothetical protein